VSKLTELGTTSDRDQPATGVVTGPPAPPSKADLFVRGTPPTVRIPVRDPELLQRPAKRARQKSKRPPPPVEPSQPDRAIDAHQLQNWAASGDLLGTIASRLGLAKKVLQRRLDAEPELLLAFESGRAAVEQELFDALRNGARKGSFVPAIFALKANFGWREQTDPPPAQANIMLVLPRAMTPEEFADQAKFIEAPKEPLP
jgi:hypothetical protein